METVCAACGAVAARGARFCNACGAALERACAACGSLEPPDALFCSACGASLQVGPAAGTREERRVVTVLFADLAGSTALGERLDPEDVRRVQHELFEFLHAEVVHHGGMTEKFIGDAVMAIFGVPQAHEDDPERAVRAALALRDGFPAFAARVQAAHGLDVGLRIGVNTGEVVAGREAAGRAEHVVSGDAVNVAARLQQNAAVGEILVGSRTRAASQRAIAYEGPRELHARGKEAVLEVWTAVDALDVPVRRGVEGLSAPLIGRDDELAILLAVARRVRGERSPELLTLFGQAGVGKSRLLGELVDRLDGVRVLEGRCLPYGDGITYWPLGEVAKSHAGILETDAAEVARGKLRQALEALVPADRVEQVFEAMAWTIGLALPGHDPGSLDSGGVRRRLADAWGRYLTSLGHECLTLLLIEDAHWASEPLLDLLESLADALTDTPVIICCPARPELLERRPGWGAGRQNATALTLAPLSTATSGRLVAALLDAERMPDEARHILDRAEGNPFFLEEILGMLLEEGVLERSGSGWASSRRIADVPIPDSVHGVVAARIDLLEPGARDALLRCSVVGRDFWPAAVGVDERLVESLGRRGLVSERPGSTVAGLREFSFKHAVTRDVAYQTLPRPERRRLHRRVAEWIHDVAPDRTAETAEIAAYHLVEALGYGEDDPVVRERAFALLLEAGLAALARAAFRGAGTLLGRALELAVGPGERALALLALGRLDAAEARYAQSLTRLREARREAAAGADHELEAEILAWESRAAWHVGAWQEAIEASDRAVTTLEGLPESPRLARALARRSQLEMLRSHPRAAEHAAEAAEVARRVGDRIAEVNARVNALSAFAAEGVAPDPAELPGIITLALDAGTLEEAFRAVVNFLWSASGFHAPEVLERWVLDALALIGERVGDMARLGDPLAPESFGSYVQLSLARLVHVPTGAWDKVDALDLDAGGVVVNAGTAMVRLELLAGMLLRRGDAAAAAGPLRELVALALPSCEPQRILPTAGIGLWQALETGEEGLYRELCEAVLACGGKPWAHAYTPASIPRALYAKGDVAMLRRFAGLAAESLATTGTTRLTAAALADLAGGDAPRAVGALEEAARVEHGNGARYEAACVELDLATALDTTGAGEQAAQVRARAHAVLGPLGAVVPA